jgi:hypothetical protein
LDPNDSSPSASDLSSREEHLFSAYQNFVCFGPWPDIPSQAVGKVTDPLIDKLADGGRVFLVFGQTSDSISAQPDQLGPFLTCEQKTVSLFLFGKIHPEDERTTLNRKEM